MVNVTFKAFMSRFLEKDSNIGDLARDIYDDENFPYTSDIAVVGRYITMLTNDREVIETLIVAMEMFAEFLWDMHSYSRISEEDDLDVEETEDRCEDCEGLE